MEESVSRGKWRLLKFDPDSVDGRSKDMITMTASFEDGVDIALQVDHAHTGTGELNGALLGLQEDIIRCLLFGFGIPNTNSTTDIGAVIIHNRVNIDHHQITR